MPRRVPCRATTEEKRQAALDVVLSLLEDGPEAVSVSAVAARLPRHGTPWVYTYVGDRDGMIRAVVDRETERLCTSLAEIAQTGLTPQMRVRTVLEALVPKLHHRSALWILVLATRLGLGQRGPLADAVSRALSPEMGPYTEGIGGGILGVLEGAVGRAWSPSREELLSVISDMTMAVALFREAATRRGTRVD